MMYFAVNIVSHCSYFFIVEIEENTKKMRGMGVGAGIFIYFVLFIVVSYILGVR